MVFDIFNWGADEEEPPKPTPIAKQVDIYAWVEPRPNNRRGPVWDRQYGQTHNPDGSPKAVRPADAAQPNVATAPMFTGQFDENNRPIYKLQNGELTTDINAALPKPVGGARVPMKNGEFVPREYPAVNQAPVGGARTPMVNGEFVPREHTYPDQRPIGGARTPMLNGEFVPRKEYPAVNQAPQGGAVPVKEDPRFVGVPTPGFKLDDTPRRSEFNEANQHLLPPVASTQTGTPTVNQDVRDRQTSVSNSMYGSPTISQEMRDRQTMLPNTPNMGSGVSTINQDMRDRQAMVTQTPQNMKGSMANLPIPIDTSTPQGGVQNALRSTTKTVTDNVKEALAAGHPKDEIVKHLRNLAGQTRDTAQKAAFTNLAFSLMADSYNEMSKGIGGAGFTGASNISAGPETGQHGAFQSKAGYNMQSNIGEHIGNALNTQLEAEGIANEYETQALVRQDALNERAKAEAAAAKLEAERLEDKRKLDAQAKAQRNYFLSQPSTMAKVMITGSNGDEVSLLDIRKTNPQLFQQTMKFLSNASLEEISKFQTDAGVSGLPPQVFGLEPPEAKDTDWSNPLVKAAGNKQEFLSGLSPRMREIYQNESWTEINNRLSKGKVVNQYYDPNGDARKWIDGKATSEGSARFAPAANNLLGSDLLKGAIGEYFTDEGEKDTVAAIKSKLPWSDARQIDAGFSLVRLYQAANITGLAGVETLTAYLNSVSSSKLGYNETAFKNSMKSALKDIADNAYTNAPEHVKLSPDTLFIRKYGAEAYIDKVIANRNSVDGKLYFDNKEQKYFLIDGAGNPSYVETN